MKPFLLSKLLLSLLVGLLLLRSDALQAVRASGTRVQATSSVEVRWHAPIADRVAPPSSATPHAPPAASTAPSSTDPFASVYIVTSRDTWQGIRGLAREAVAEYDSTGRHGLEHVGRREAVDRRKDRALRSVQWEVVRIRTGHLEALGPFDVQAGSTGRRTLSRLLDAFRAIRGDLIVEAYRR